MKTEPLDVLFVEDNEDDIVMVREAFLDAKLINILHVVSDGEEALRYLRREAPYEAVKRPGLVLLDINMPKLNGFEVLDAMKSDELLRSIPVVVLTTSRRDEDVIRSYSGGACSYISKPVDFEGLKEVTKQFELYWAMVAEVPPPKRGLP